MACSAKEKVVDFKTFTPSDAPNHFLACPKGYCQVQPDMQSPIYSVSVAELTQIWQQIIAETPRHTTFNADEKLRRYGYIIRTRWLRFPDTISVQFVSIDDNHSSVAIFSQSNYGYYDFGVNRRRVTAWLDALSQATSS